MITLHRYILSELLKTFLLAAVAVTTLFVLGGGIFNAVSRQGLGGEAILALMPLLIQGGLTITVPIAALFAGTIVYGRLAADNELVACRAAGINLARVFLAAGLLALFVGLFAALFVNFVLPGMIGRAEAFLKNNLRGIAEQQLQTKGYIASERFFRGELYMTGEDVETRFDPAQLRARGWDPELDYISIQAPTFLQLDENGEVERFLVAADGWVQFDTQHDPVEVFAIVRDAWDLSVAPQPMIAHSENTPVGPIPVALPIRSNPSFLTLTRLIEVQRQPWTYPEIGEAIADYKSDLVRRQAQLDLVERLAAGVGVELEDQDGGRLTLTATTATAAPRHRIELTGITLRRESAEPGVATRLVAAAGGLAPLPVRRGAEAVAVELVLTSVDGQPVTLTRPGDPAFGPPRTRKEERLRGLRLVDVAVGELLGVDAATVLGPTEPPVMQTAELVEERGAIRAAAAALGREVAALHHFRFGYAVGALVAVLIGATLGVIFRSHRALLAFGLSVVPLLVLGVLLMAGRQNAERAGTELVGLAIIWGGIGLMVVANGVLQFVGIRR